MITRDYALDLLESAEGILSKEEIVLKRHASCTFFIGDIHGDLSAWRKIKDIIGKEGDLTIFLGDYVDRGQNSVEVIIETLELKISDPKKFILLRGNHETQEINSYYGFLWELKRKFPSDYKLLYSRFNEIFAQMPIATVVDNARILAIHGGIPIQAKSVGDLDRIPKGSISISNPLLLQALWNDPDDTITDYSPSPRGPGIYLFGWKIFNTFMDNSKLRLMIRGHTYLPEGSRYFFNGKLLSIFSPLNYVGGRVRGRIVMSCNKEIEIIDLVRE